MTKSELRKLIKIEKRIHDIAKDELGLDFYPIEFDIIPPQKMLEIMAYHIPTNISNWKFGREYEKQRTIYEHQSASMPYEVVINSNPAKAYLMNDNKFAIQVLVMAHVYGHCAFFTMNRYFLNSRQDIVGIMYEASQRFKKYERSYGIEEVERTTDAGHALQWHSSPFESNETENEKRRRVFEQQKKEIHTSEGSFVDVLGSTKEAVNEDIELYNQKMWRKLKLKTPVEPTEDILRYVIDNSFILEDWQKDILEVLRMEGQYYWPIIKTKFMNEGFAVRVHEKIVNQLFEEGYLSNSDMADFNYSNSLVKANHPFQLNPYAVGFGVWESIENRWDKGQHGQDWEDCNDVIAKEEWDTKDNKGWEKCLEVLGTYTDWFFMMDFLTPEVVKDLDLYIYKAEDKTSVVDYVITKDDAKKIRQKIINAFGHERMPKICIVNGNYQDRGWLELEHKFAGIPLDETHAKKTMDHLAYLWGKPITMNTKDDSSEISWKISPEGWEAEDPVDEDKKDD